jgi:hypothetical protein
MTTDEETRRRWYATLEQSRALLDRPVPEPTKDLFRPDVLEAWARNMPPKVEPEPVKPTVEIHSTAPIDIHAEIERAVSAAIEAEHEATSELLLEVVGTVHKALEAIEVVAAELQLERQLRRNNADQRSTDTTTDNVTALPRRPGIQRRARA